MTLAAAFAWALAGLTAVCSLIALSIGSRRIFRERRERRVERLVGPLRSTVYDLVSGEPHEIAAAVAALRGVDDATWEPLQDLLIELFGKLRGEALAPVRRLLDERRVVERAQRNLTSPSAVSRARAAYLLGLVQHRESRPALERLLADRDPDVRIVACRAVGQLGDPASAPALLGALSAARPVPAGVVGDALLGLGAGAEPALQAALTARDANTREVAVDTGGLGGLVGIVPAVRHLLATDPQPDIRARAAVALGRLGSAAALPELIDATNAAQPAAVRLAAAEALGLIGDLDALVPLTSLLDAHDLLADAAARALVELGPSGLAALREHAEPNRPSAAAGALAMASLRAGVR